MSKEYTRKEAITLIDTLWRKLAEKIEKVSSKSMDDTEESGVELYLKTAGGIFMENRKSADITKVLLEYDNGTIAKILSKSIQSVIGLRLCEDLSEDFIVVDCEHSYDGAIDVATYIVEEIKRNVKSKEAQEIYELLHYDLYLKKFYSFFTETGKALVEPPNPLVLKATAITKWISMVNTGKAWDHKWQIKEKFSNVAVKDRRNKSSKGGYKQFQSHYHKYKYHDYFYDVWSNIHYGFVGRYCGFSRQELLTGSDMQQIFSNIKNLKFFQGDDIADEVTMKFGMDLYEEYKDNIDSLSYTVVLNGLEAMESVGTSRLLHKCLDTSSTGITVI